MAKKKSFLGILEKSAHTKNIASVLYSCNDVSEFGYLLRSDPQTKEEKTNSVNDIVQRLDIKYDSFKSILAKRLNSSNRPNMFTFEKNYRILQDYFGNKDVIWQVKVALENRYARQISIDEAIYTTISLAAVGSVKLAANLVLHEEAGVDKHDLNFHLLRKNPFAVEDALFSYNK